MSLIYYEQSRRNKKEFKREYSLLYKMSRYFKHQELVIFDLANGNRQQMRLDSLYPIDKMRISVFDAVDNTQYKPVIVVNSDLTNSVIGTAATNYIDNTIGFLSNLKPLVNLLLAGVLY